MKKTYILASIILISSVIMILPAKNSIAYYGEGDCTHEHETVYINIPLDSTASINLDGKGEESFWTKASNQRGNLIIKLSEEQTGTEIPKIYDLNITFVMNNEYIYILCTWEDNTPLYEGSGEKDGLSFCWNINTPNFSAYYVSDMNTAHMGGGKVDAWRWAYDDIKSPGEVHTSSDDCFDENGWIQGNPEANSIEVAYTNTSNSYTLEMRRKRNTNEEYDVQFNKKRIYEFNVAILNDNEYEDHAISWTHALDLREGGETIMGFPIIFMAIGIILSIAIIYFKFKESFNDL